MSSSVILFSDNAEIWHLWEKSSIMPSHSERFGLHQQTPTDPRIMPYSLDKTETRFFSYTQSRQCPTVETGVIGTMLQLSQEQERKLLSRLSCQGLIARVRRGLYLVPPTLPPGGRWSPSEALALNTLMEDCSGQYQICGPNTFNRYGWDEQVPNRLYVYNDKLSGNRQIGAVSISLIKISPARLGAVDTVQTPEGHVLHYSNRVRALLDAVYDWSRFYGLPRAYEWTRTEIRSGKITAAELINVSIRYGNQGTLRRLGCLLDEMGIAEGLLAKLARELNPVASKIPFVPTNPNRGQVNKRWGVVLNDK